MVEHPDAVSVWHLNVVQVPERDRVIELMAERGVDIRIHYPQPCHLHASLEEQPRLPVVEASAPRIASLPMYPTISAEEINYVCDSLAAVLAELGHG